MKKSEIVGNAMIACFFSGMLVYSSQLHQMRRFGEVGGGFWPMLTLALATLFSISLLIRNVLTYWKEKHTPFSAASPAPDGATLADEREGRKRYVVSGSILLLYIIVMPWIGFLLATVFFIAAFIYALGEKRKIVQLIAPPVLTAIIIIIFGTLIGIRFPRGPGLLAAISRLIY